MGWGDPEAAAALWLTVQVAGTAILFGLPLAIAVSYVLARYRFPGHMLLNGLVHLPLVMPPVVTGYGLLLLFGPAGPLGRFLNDVFGVGLAFRWTGAALAAAIMAFPLMVRPIRVAIESVDMGLESAAETLGANRVMVFFTVTLPLALPGILAAAILGFAKALGEFGATITFVSNIPGETRTLALAIYSLTQSPDGDRAALMLAGLAAVLAFSAVIASEVVVRRMQARLSGGRR
ncbi:molybdate ABC transporter permease subunit [Coralliovum pocilloporae]|uniref:molybdate ABC transporter permease subunit n=1 Tax=Coralliovum pocilloporae TaxID=3066369 RepID=UPI003307907E